MKIHLSCMQGKMPMDFLRQKVTRFGNLIIRESA